MSTLLVLLALLVATLQNVTAPTAILAAGPGPDIGVAPYQPQQGDGKTLPTTVLQRGFTMALLGNNSLVRSIGFEWVSYTLGWDTAEPERGQFNWGDADNIVNGARNAGVNVMIRVGRSPIWARDASCSTDPTCPPTDPQSYGNFLGALANHVRPLKGTIRVAYELWNEPNTDLEWGGQCPDPQRYTDMIRAAYPRIKSADQNATVVAGAVATVGQVLASHCAMDDIAFLRAMYDAGAAPYFDVLSDHPYGFIYTPETDPSTSGPRLVFRRAERHRDLMIEYGDGAKQIWATEMGWALDPARVGYPQCARPEWFYVFSPQQQANYLVRAYTWANANWAWMGVMFTFNFDFGEAPWYQSCDAFRFWSVKGRPAQTALRGMVTGVYFADVPTDYWAYPYVAYLASAGIISGYSDQTFQPSNNATRGQFSKIVAIAEDWSTDLTGAPHFTDVAPDYVFYPFIETAVNHGIISGYSDDTFLPNDNITRAQIAKIIVLSEGWPLVNPPTPSFADAPPDSALYRYVETAVAHRIVSGYGDGTFHPNDNATRAQISKMVYLTLFTR